MINIDELIKSAVLTRNKDKALVYKQIKTRIMEFKTGDKDPKTGKYPVYNEDEEIKLLNTMVKELEKDIDVFSKINNDKAKDNIKEAECQKSVILELLPKVATDDEIIEVINKVVDNILIEHTNILPNMFGMILNRISIQMPNARKQDIARLMKHNTYIYQNKAL